MPIFIIVYCNKSEHLPLVDPVAPSRASSQRLVLMHNLGTAAGRSGKL